MRGGVVSACCRCVEGDRACLRVAGMVEDIPDDSVRIGHPERERAVGLLNEAFASGYLDVTEFEERSSIVYAGRTRGELRAMFVDLPNAGLLFPDVVASGPGAQQDVPPAAVSAPAEWSIDWDTVRRKGRWQVPSRVLVTGWMGTLDLDFTRATFPGPSVELQMHVSTSTVKVRVGSGQEIRCQDLTTSGWSSIKDKAGAPGGPGGPVITVTGSLSAMSGLVIKRSG